MMALGTLLRKPPLPPGSCRAFWGWLNAVFNKVDHERIRAVGPDRAASEWLLRCGALVRYQGSPKWQQDYNALPTGPLGRYKIEAINATDSCIMYRGFDYLGWSWNSGANPALCLCRWPGARYRHQAGEVHVHPGRVSAEAQRDQQPPEESAAAEDHLLWQCHRQRHPCTPQAEEPGIFVSE
ncbi:ATP synthase subunit s, mitochondrial isoform X3 [Haemorhous mexicanus]|uniref:ATP synthase subunit s, mitochondrial isoform X3 n=1 Tax=Haemorhous mexicanus TaxID=30427 RepID=UPI0028BF4677|nr:ATP synthase subunit s, mitochondrial isoform X3 [Haemorhous mexicanus]